MQGDVERIRRELEDIIERLESLNLESVRKAIEELKIALKDLEGGMRRSSEGFDHYSAKLRLIEELTRDGGSCYLESEQTKLSKIGYRPDAVIVKDDEVVILEVETDQRRMVRKLRKIGKLKDTILSSPLLTGRRLRIVFGVTEDRLREDVVKEAKRIGEIEIYFVSGDRILRLF